jgi:hypothetical protein
VATDHKLDQTLPHSSARSGGEPPRHRSWRRGDLRARSFPRPATKEPWVTDSRHRLDAIEALRDWAEGQAEDAIDWYLKDKAIRRVGSRLLRALAIVLVVAGGLMPLLSAAWTGNAAGWGYVLLAAAAGCVAFDHFFGLSSGWMRDMAAAQTLQRRLTEFRLEWTTNLLRPASHTAEQVAGGGSAVDDAELTRRLNLVGQFAMEIADLVESETSEWLTEFRSSVGRLDGQTAWPTTSGHQINTGG